MGCPSCGNKSSGLDGPTINNMINPPKIGPLRNLIEAGGQQTDKFSWFRDGITGIVKCFTGQSKYSDEDIVKNRDVCRKCPHAAIADDGKLTNASQCMAPDPGKNGAPCGCFIVCKTQNGECPINSWTHLTINRDKLNNKTKPVLDNNNIVEI